MVNACRLLRPHLEARNGGLQARVHTKSCTEPTPNVYALLMSTPNVYAVRGGLGPAEHPPPPTHTHTLKPEMVSLRSTYFPGEPVNTSATWAQTVCMCVCVCVRTHVLSGGASEHLNDLGTNVCVCVCACASRRSRWTPQPSGHECTCVTVCVCVRFPGEPVNASATCTVNTRRA